MHSYLLNRCGNYHVRIRVPADLSTAITSAEFVKSLKTRDQKQAHLLAYQYLEGIRRTFSLFRSGYITAEQLREQIDHVLKRAPKDVVPLKRRAMQVPSPQVSSTEGCRLSNVISTFVSDKEGGWSAKTKMENDASFRLLVDVVGNLPLQSVDRDLVRRLRENLRILPGNVYKLLPNMTISQITHEIMAGRCTYPPMTTTTVNKHLSRFSTLMAYCVEEGMLSSNPAVGMALKQKRKAYEERKSYTLDDVKAIVDNLPRTGEEPERYWIPLIGIYSGMRLDEICQLYTSDIRTINGVWCFDVNNYEDKKVKTLSSQRIVPLHPHFFALGFLDYVREVKNAGKPRLWMNLKRRDADGYGSAYGKVFQRFNRKYITSDPLKTFHSLRHTFADALKQQGEQESLIAELLGHANGSITTGRYGKRYNPSVLLNAITKLDFGMPELLLHNADAVKQVEAEE